MVKDGRCRVNLFLAGWPLLKPSGPPGGRPGAGLPTRSQASQPPAAPLRPRLLVKRTRSIPHPSISRAYTRARVNGASLRAQGAGRCKRDRRAQGQRQAATGGGGVWLSPPHMARPGAVSISAFPAAGARSSSPAATGCRRSPLAGSLSPYAYSEALIIPL